MPMFVASSQNKQLLIRMLIACFFCLILLFLGEYAIVAPLFLIVCMVCMVCVCVCVCVCVNVCVTFCQVVNPLTAK